MGLTGLTDLCISHGFSKWTPDTVMTNVYLYVTTQLNAGIYRPFVYIEIAACPMNLLQERHEKGY